MPKRFKNTKYPFTLHAPPCLECKSNIHAAPMTIQLRSLNNAKLIQEFLFCSPACLAKYVKSPTWLRYENSFFGIGFAS